MDIDRIIQKYTDGQGTDDHAGQPVTANAITARAVTDGHRGGDPTRAALALALQRATYAIAATETELAQVTGWIGERLDKIHATLAAAAGQHAPTLNPIGELQAHAPRIDALIAVRAAHIGHLQALTRIWRAGQPATP